MAFIRYKKRGEKWYVYTVTAFWDKVARTPRQKSTYIGVAQEKNGPYEKLGRVKKSKSKEHVIEKSIVDFGDSYAIQEVIKNIGLNTIIEETLNYGDSLKALLCYQMTEGKAMYHCLDWMEGNIASTLFPQAKLESQDISRMFNYLGNQSIQNTFFTRYLTHFFKDTHGVLIDSTALPSAINTAISACGYSSAGLVEHVSCLMLVDKKTQLPLYFRAISGELADVSTLQTTLKEIQLLGLKVEEAIFDAGYFSEKNIQYLCEQKINFISRLPKSRIVFKELVKKAGNLETCEQAIHYGKRVVFVKTLETEAFGEKLAAHVILDPYKKVKDTQRLLIEADDDSKSPGDVNEAMAYCGFFILISRAPIKPEDVLPTYYTRQSIEQVFGIAKSQASILPLRVHSEQSIKGYLLLVFISLIIFMSMRQKLKKEYTVEQALLILRSLKAKKYDAEILVQENTKKVKDIAKLLDIIMPINLGI